MGKLILFIGLAIFLVSVGFVASSPTLPNVSGISVSYDNAKSYTPSQAEIDCQNNGGCFDNKTNRCYSIGYVRKGTFCKEDGITYGYVLHKSGFVNQSSEGQNCTQNYECNTNLCSNNVCVNLTKIQSENNFADNSSANAVNNSVENISANSNKTLMTGEVVNTQNENFLSKVLLFFKKIFGL